MGSTHRVLVVLLILASAMTGGIARLGPSGPGTARASIAPAPVTSTYDVPFAAPGGTILRLDVHRPQGSAGLPSLIVIHGGRWTSGDKSNITRVAQAWARLGYVVFNVNYRLATSETDSAAGIRYPAPLEDIRAAVAWVRGHADEYGGNPGRVGLFGGSAGGHLALLAAMQDTGIDGVVSWSGPTDLARMWEQRQQTDAIAALLGCRDSAADPCPVAEEASPISHVSSGDPPTYLANGSDERVPVEQVDVMAMALEASAVPHLTQIVPGSLHGWDLQRYSARPTEQFLRKYLCGPGTVPGASVGDVSVAEGETLVTAMFPVTLAAPTCRNVSVQFRTVDGTATAGFDYTAAAGTVTIPAGRTTGSIRVDILADAELERDETFTVALTSAMGATVADTQGTGTIEGARAGESDQLLLQSH
jgi:acetyl esterase/lipase